MRKPAVLLPVLIQDPTVLSDTSRAMSLIHPVVVKDPKGGFTEGPTCRRVAIVDFNFNTGRYGARARFEPKGSPYRNVAAYRVSLPTRKGARVAPWSRSKLKVPLETLGSSRYDDPFLKVSVFGTVLRTIGLVQDSVALGREVRWAFPGKQLLVVPRAGALDNAFYHRQSQSLRFYYGVSGRSRAVYTGLSQDIVAHETTHAILDGIAPSLYDALSSETLAIHEAIADITAALLSMRNRELLTREARDSVKTSRELQESSRFTRIAEEFGKFRGHGEALRDVCNSKTLDTKGADPAQIVDDSSPHSLSEVLSGALFDVLRNEFAVMGTDASLRRALNADRDAKDDPLRWRATYAVNRVLCLIYKGLDLLPPGEASFAELIRAMVVADELYLPKLTTARGMILRSAAERGVRCQPPSSGATLGFDDRTNLFQSLPADSDARRAFVDRHREWLSVPDGVPVQMRCRLHDVYEPQLFLELRKGESFSLSPTLTSRERAGRSKHLMVKLGWWATERNDLGAAWGQKRRYRAGATLLIDREGEVRAVLLAGATPSQAQRRSKFLQRLLGDQTSHRRQRGPDGARLQQLIRTQLSGNTLSVSGAFQALHIVQDDAA